jgi:hypothetical protein
MPSRDDDRDDDDRYDDDRDDDDRDDDDRDDDDRDDDDRDDDGDEDGMMMEMLVLALAQRDVGLQRRDDASLRSMSCGLARPSHLKMCIIRK